MECAGEKKQCVNVCYDVGVGAGVDTDEQS